MSSALHQVHGMAGEYEAAHWPALTVAEVTRLLATFPAVHGPFVLGWHSPRPLSAAVLVQAGEHTLFVKRHHASVRTPATLGEEHRFMQHLREHGMPIPRLLADRDGATAVRLGDWTYEVHEHAAGTDAYRDRMSWTPPRSPWHARAAGAMLAKLGNAAASYRAPQRRTHLLVARTELLCAADPIAALAAQLPERPDLAAYLAQRPWQQDLADLLAPWHADVQPRLAQQSAQWTHGDWHVSNLCWSGPGDDARITAVFDFGLAARTFALFDLATAIERNAIAWLELTSGAAAARIDMALALLDGYRRVVALDRSAVHLLADLLPLVHLDFALSEVEYLQATGHAAVVIDTAYDTFLRGHAAWFSTAAGRALLQAIHAAA